MGTNLCKFIVGENNSVCVLRKPDEEWLPQYFGSGCKAKVNFIMETAPVV